MHPLNEITFQLVITFYSWYKICPLPKLFKLTNKDIYTIRGLYEQAIKSMNITEKRKESPAAAEM